MAGVLVSKALPLLLAMLGSASADMGDDTCAMQLRGQYTKMAEDPCGAAGEDPYSSEGGADGNGNCCDGLRKCLKNWNDNGKWHYKCYADCDNTDVAPTPMPPTSAPSPLPPAPAPSPMGACLCVFDLDRTLTGEQEKTSECPHNTVINDCTDTAYTGGKLTLSEVGQTLEGTFCAEQKCYVGIVSTGDASGRDSSERKHMVDLLTKGGGKLVSSDWNGPSKDGENRRSCQGITVTSPLVVGCADGSKQYAVESMIQWFRHEKNVDLLESNVWFFDDRKDNVEPFSATKINARQISCGSRDTGGRFDKIGRCGATTSEIVQDKGVKTCT